MSLVRGLSLALLAGWIALPCAMALASAPQQNGGGGGYGSGSSDSLEDEVGSLPTIRDDGLDRVDDSQAGTAHELLLDPSLVLAGPVPALRTLVADAFGPGTVSIETLAPGTERWTFRGEPTVLLRRDAVMRGLVEIRVDVGLRFAGGAASVEWFGGSTPALRLPFLGSLDLPLGQLVDAGVLDGQSAALHLVGLQGARASFGLRATREVVSVVQRRD